MFLGISFARNSSSNDIVGHNATFNAVTLANANFDDIYATKKDIPIGEYDWTIPDDWDYDMIMKSNFNTNANAGNLDNSIDEIGGIKLKRRYPEDDNPVWETIFYREKKSIEDFDLNLMDYLEPSNKVVEYMFVPVFTNGADIADEKINAKSVISKFYETFLSDANMSYPAIVDVSNDPMLNVQKQVITTLGRKYPYVIRNGISQYHSGQMTVTFIPINCAKALDEQVDVENGWKYRNVLDKWLLNNDAKLIKTFEGDIYLVQLSGGTERHTNGHYQNVATSFNWAEVGDAFSVSDLYENGLINTDIDAEVDV